MNVKAQENTKNRYRIMLQKRFGGPNFWVLFNLIKLQLAIVITRKY